MQILLPGRMQQGSSLRNANLWMLVQYAQHLVSNKETTLESVHASVTVSSSEYVYGTGYLSFTFH